jgi:glycosyltransferase involved in cell wall biosynthesis
MNPPPKDVDRDSTIAIDGVFFEIASTTGIARVWKELFVRWQDAAIGRRIVLLDRNGSLPRFERLRSVPCPAFDAAKWEDDRALVQQLCDSVGARLFISTYYTRAQRTPSVLLVHDLIPERMGFDLALPVWRQKHDAIQHAAGFAAISETTLADLGHYFPETFGKPTIVARPGAGPEFFPSSAEERLSFNAKLIVPHLDGRPFYLFLGTPAPYKNMDVVTRAFRAMPASERAKVAVVVTHSGIRLDEFRALPGAKVHATRFSDRGLRAAYSSALALIYPSRYEGFGLPTLEAMACGCPVIAANTSSIPETVGDAALLIDPDAEDELRASLLSVRDPVTRERLRLRGFERVKAFSWDTMASILAEFLQSRLEASSG